MRESEDEDVESVWTNSNLLKLLASLDETIPEGLDTTSYQKGMKSVDWNKVAFHPFSPEECRKKWTNIMDKMRKLRSLPDLIAEAKKVVSDPLHFRAVSALQHTCCTDVMKPGVLEVSLQRYLYCKGFTVKAQVTFLNFTMLPGRKASVRKAESAKMYEDSLEPAAKDKYLAKTANS